jgi:hypothetical protein
MVLPQYLVLSSVHNLCVLYMDRAYPRMEQHLPVGHDWPLHRAPQRVPDMPNELGDAMGGRVPKVVWQPELQQSSPVPLS